MMPSLLIAMALTIHLAQNTGTGALTRPEPGLWGAQAVHLSESAIVGATSQGGRIVEAMSPDRLKAVSVRDSQLSVEVSGRFVNPREPIAIGSLAEVLWAPDSKAFAITESDGGLVGTWSVRLFRVVGEMLQEVQVTGRVRGNFQSRAGGCRDEVPNVGAIGFSKSAQLLIVAEAPPHSSCRDMGTVKVYELSIPTGRVVRTFDSAALRSCCQIFLGTRFKRGQP